jgi:hypothetical protein
LRSQFTPNRGVGGLGPATPLLGFSEMLLIATFVFR